MTAEPYLLDNPLSKWAAYKARIAAGEIVPPDERVPPPPIVSGVCLRSATICRSIDTTTTVGGMVVSPGTDGGWLTVEARVDPNRIEYHLIADDDINWRLYEGCPNVPYLKDLRRAINADRTRRGHENDHMAALNVIGSVLA